jgi:monovalent cation:H+ antiporter-2, CPA2 family
VLARLGEAHGVVDSEAMRPLLAAGVASMFLTPLLVRAAPHITAGERLLAPLERLIGVRSIDQPEAATETIRDHVIIVGFGVAGWLTAQSLEACKIPYLALELDSDRVRRAKADGLAVFYGDATSEEALGHAHLTEARAIVLLMNDAHAIQRVVEVAGRIAPKVPILTRTRLLVDRPKLLRTGAREVVAEEVEGAVEVITRLLRWSQVTDAVIDERLGEIRELTTP